MRSLAPRHVRKRDVNEEPGAGELHAGICEGGAKQLASLPRLRGATSGASRASQTAQRAAGSCQQEAIEHSLGT